MLLRCFYWYRYCYDKVSTIFISQFQLGFYQVFERCSLREIYQNVIVISNKNHASQQLCSEQAACHWHCGVDVWYPRLSDWTRLQWALHSQQHTKCWRGDHSLCDGWLHSSSQITWLHWGDRTYCLIFLIYRVWLKITPLQNLIIFRII